MTGCVLVDLQGNRQTAKVLSTKDDPVTGVVAGLSRLAETVGVDLPTLLGRTERLGHGTTAAAASCPASESLRR